MTDPHPVADDPSGIVQQMPEFVILPDPKRDLDELADLRAEVERLREAPPPAAPTDNTALVERHANKQRNVIINRCSTDLETIINGHDPEIGNLNNDVWDRLDKMAVEIEAALASREAPPAAQEPEPDGCLHGYCDAENCPACSQEEQEAPPACQQEAVLLEIIEWCHNQIGNYPDWFDRARKAVGQFDGDAGDPAPRIAEVAALGLALIEQDELGGKAGWDAFANALRELEGRKDG